MSARPAVALCLALAAAGATAAPVRTGHVTAELVAQKTAFVPGADNVVALKLTLDKGWHTYWRNAGDSGLPTTLAWTLPAGISAGPIEWLPPQLLPAGPLTNYGYEGVAWHPVTLHAAPGAALGSHVALAARADWLVCRETCIPEGADLTLTLPVATQAVDDPRDGAAITAARARVPAPLAAGWSASARGEGQRVALELRPPAGAADPGVLRFFPNDDGRIEPSGAQALARRGNDYVLTLPVAWQLDKGFTRVTGLLAASGAGFGGARAATIDVPLEGAVVAGAKPVDAEAAPLALGVAAPVANDTMTLALAALFAFVGGMILNLMPCVFPVLSLKVLGFATRQDDRATMRREALAFAAGVVVTFVLLAMMLLALRAAGQELGWGFQLQSPVVVTALAVLFFALGLNLAGVFEFGQLAPAAWRGWTSSNRTLDAFGSGVLAVVVASPCTAPFMGAALGFALSRSAASTLAIFVMLGIGMALPYALLAWFPAWRQRLPRPGVWMLRLKQLLAFPMFATVAWLAWVLGAQIDNDAVLRLCVVLIAMAFALWALNVRRGGGARAFGVAALVAAAVALVLAAPLATISTRDATVAQASAADAWQPFTPETVRDLAAAGRPVFVDFTAAWCVTCQVNKRTTLARAAVREAFARANVALVRADWTRRNPVITEALAALGRNGVPAYVLYRPGKPPLLLPEILTQQAVIDALATLPAQAAAGVRSGAAVATGYGAASQ
ncbi:MAG TPA: thioredoxin family protein [Casimicrobiaceae bacterium]|nr:thioredoxin family protein [Casimicrobiaceae bacterium]